MSSLLLRDARIVPLRAGRVSSEPVDVLVDRGLVRAVGKGLERPHGFEEVAAQGRFLIPGLWDQHVHLGQWTLASQRLDTSGMRSPEETVRLVADEVAAEPGRPVIGFGHRPAVWSREVTVTELDDVAGVTPVVLIAGDAHHAWLNSSALAALGLPNRDTVIRENEWFAAYEILSALVDGDGTSPQAYRRTLKEAASRGLVGLVDFEFTGGMREWCERWLTGCDVIRLRMATYAQGLEKVIAAGVRTGDPLPGAGDSRLTMGPLKIISDGSLNTRTAWCCDPYADADTLDEPSGAANLPPHELTALLARAHMSGLEVSTHAIGDAAAGAALNAYYETGARGSIEHAQLMSRDDVRRMAELDLRASVQPAHLIDDRDLTDLIWPGRGQRSFAYRWMLDDGVRLVLGSDAPVAPLDPWLAMAAAVHRSGDDRPAWHPEHALTAQEALAASVDGQSTVGAGSTADLALLDADPLTIGDDDVSTARVLRDMTVSLTLVGGRVVHTTI